MEWVITAAVIPGSVEFGIDTAVGWLALAVAVLPLVLAARQVIACKPRTGRFAAMRGIHPRPAPARRAA